jgi:hypothetical protein
VRAADVSSLFSVMHAAMRRSIRAHQLTGTVQVNAIVMFPGGGFAIARPTQWAG